MTYNICKECGKFKLVDSEVMICTDCINKLFKRHVNNRLRKLHKI